MSDPAFDLRRLVPNREICAFPIGVAGFYPVIVSGKPLTFMVSPSPLSLRSLFAFIVALPLSMSAADYYLGSDAASQPGVALADIAALNACALQPGDRIFFQ